MSNSRYIRQEIIASVGERGQQKLRQSRVFVVGAGGLGCPALLYLAGAGVGTIGIADGDNVDVTNLHRQVLFTEESVGRNKATEAARLLSLRNSDIRFEVIDRSVSSDDFNFMTLRWDVVIDATDRLDTRYLLDDLCRIQNTPLVHASVSGDEIQVAVFDTTSDDANDRVCYRDLYPHASRQSIRTCTEEGILGPVPGIAGLIQARECLGLLTGAGSELKGKVLWLDTVRYHRRIFNIPPRKSHEANMPRSLQEVAITNYEALCGNQTEKSPVLDNWILALQSGAVLIDVRETDEQPRISESLSRQIPFGRFDELYQHLESHNKIVVFCQSGSRGEKACQKLLARWPDKIVLNIPGGIQTLNQYMPIYTSSTP